MNIFKGNNLKIGRFQEFAKKLQDNEPESSSLFPNEIIFTIKFFKNINYSVLNLNNGECEQYKMALFQSFSTLETILQKSSKDILNAEINDLVDLISDIFTHIDIDIDDFQLSYFYNSILKQVLHCMCYIALLEPAMFQNVHNDLFINRLVRVLKFDTDIEENHDIIDCSQLFFSKVIENKVFRTSKNYIFWTTISESIKDTNVLSSIYYELSKDVQYFNIDYINTFLYSILNIFPEKNYLNERIQSVKKNTESIINCIKNVDNILILSQAKIDIFQFMPKIINLILILKSFSELKGTILVSDNNDINRSEIISAIEMQNTHIICFCRLMQCFIKKGIINDAKFFAQNDFYIITSLANIFTSVGALNEDNMLFFSSNNSDEAIESILKLFSLFIDYFRMPLHEIISMSRCVDFALESPFKVRKASALLVCQMIKKDIIPLQCYIFEDFKFFYLLINLIIIPALEIIEPLLDCLFTLFEDSDDFVSFIVHPKSFEPDEFQNLINALNEIKESIHDENIEDAVDNILWHLVKNSRKTNDNLYGSNNSQNNVYDENVYDENDEFYI